MKITNKNTGEFFDVDFKKIQGEELILCPACSHTRKKKNQKCLSWNHDIQAGKCFNCDSAFYIRKTKIEEKKYIRPEWNNNTEFDPNYHKSSGNDEPKLLFSLGFEKAGKKVVPEQDPRTTQDELPCNESPEVLFSLAQNY